jgi:HK97 family phage prohead protease
MKGGGGNTLTGSIAVFNSLSEDLGGFRELLAPGCFTSSLKGDIRALVNHSTSACVGRTTAGTLRLTQDEHGLQFECDLPDTTAARDLKVSCERGDVTGCSFGFICKDDDWAVTDQETIRTVKDAELFEVSVGVTFPAYEDSHAQLRSMFPDGAVAIPKHEKRSNANDCACDCPECQGDDCADCSDTDCDDPNCLANQRSKAFSAERCRMEMQLALLK